MTMAFSVNNIARVTAGWLQGAANSIQNVLTMELTDLGSADQDALIDFILDVVEVIYDDAIIAISDQLLTAGINIFNRTKSEPYGTHDWPTLNGGGAGGSMLPLQVTYDAYGQTAVNKVRGRKSWPVSTEDNITGGVFTGDAATGFGAASTAWLQDFTDIPSGADVAMGVERSVGLGAGTLAPFTGGGIHTLAFTRKNRRPGLGS